MKVVSLALIMLSSFFSFGYFLRLAVGLFWPRFVLVSDRFVAVFFSLLPLSLTD